MPIIITCVQNHFSCVWLFATPWNIAWEASLSMEFSREEHWSGLPWPASGDLPDPGIEPTSLMPLALAGGSFITSTTWEAHLTWELLYKKMSFYAASIVPGTQKTMKDSNFLLFDFLSLIPTPVRRVVKWTMPHGSIKYGSFMLRPQA